MENAQSAPLEHAGRRAGPRRPNSGLALPDYTRSSASLLDRALAFLAGFAAGFALLYIFYKIVLLALIGALICGTVNIFWAEQRSVRKRQAKLRRQFFDLLEALSVSMRAGNPVSRALQSARDGLLLIYAEESDIISELSIISGKFNNAVPLSAAFADLAQRSGLEDIASFAAIYAAIEGKSSRADEIIRQTQQIIADKMEIEMEIETMMTAAKNEVNIMLVMPLVILGVIGYAGAGFIDAIYTTALGRAVSSLGLAVFIISFVMARKISDIKL
jgi:tight adherence protein B